MSTDEAIRDATLDQRVVLLALLGASQDRSTPVNPAELRQVCNERLAGSDGPLAGGFSEADVTRALYSLESAGLVENVAEGDQSPAGKGRPAYKLVPDAGSVRSALAADDTLEPLLEAVD